jgi:L-asparagine oxygenase
MWIHRQIDESEAERIISKYGERDVNNYGETEIIFPGKPSKSGHSLTDKYGMGAFPLHTDVAYWSTPARYLAFYCLNPGEGKRTTQIVNLENHLEELVEVVDHANDLFIIRPRSKPFYTQIINGSIGHRWIRWDPEIMTPVIDSDIKIRVEHFIMDQNVYEIEWESRMLVIINNRTSVHGRGQSAVNDSNRMLKRILIK